MYKPSGIKRLLLGIEVTVFGGVLVLAALANTPNGPSPLSMIGLVVAAVGLFIALAGMVPGQEA
jgi:hypothetical protein